MTAAADLRSTARRIDTAKYRVIRSVGRTVDQIAKTASRPATGGDAVLTGKHRPIKLRTRTRIAEAGGAVTSATVYGVPPGPWRWINDGTAAHRIRRRKRGPERNMFVDHPGTTGHGSWDDAYRVAAKRIPLEMTRAIVKEVRR